MKTYNIGEWSEIYTFLKLLADGKIYAADLNLDIIEDIYYPLISILRTEGGKNLRFDRNSAIKIVSAAKDKVIAEIPIETFRDNSLKLLEAMKGARSSVFSVPDVEEFLRNIKITNLKAPSREKYDITMVVHDFRTGLNPELKMSIKSMIGSPSTLLNPGLSTNFVYRISGKFTHAHVSATNSIEGLNKLIERLKYISNTKSTLEFEKIQSDCFENNMRMIDSNLSRIFAHLLKYFYLHNHNSIKVLTEKIEEDDPLGFYENENLGFYTHKIKNFLFAVALGMTPSKAWDGKYSATGGYIIVKPDGMLVIYHLYNIDEFKEYLLNNTRLDKPSSSRYAYAKVYTEDEDYKIKLNLQVRFTS